MNKLFTCDFCQSKVEHVAIIFPETDEEMYCCKNCAENFWNQIYEKETQHSS